MTSKKARLVQPSDQGGGQQSLSIELLITASQANAHNTTSMGSSKDVYEGCLMMHRVKEEGLPKIAIRVMKLNSIEMKIRAIALFSILIGVNDCGLLASIV
jgi:hypothetical protein